MPDQLLPQPPPDAPAPGPIVEALRSRRKMRWLITIVVGLIVLMAFAGLTAPPIKILSPRKREITEATANARQIGLALLTFQNEYGEYPNPATAAAVREATGSTLRLTGNTSNDFFAQLLAANITHTEKMFYAKSKFSKKPDDVWTSDADVLSCGECGFAYIAGVDPAGPPETPIAFGPAIPGTTTLDRKSCEGKAVVLRTDSSATTLPINSAGKIMDNGMDILDPRQPYWHGKAPDVKWPK